jgi:cobalt/nickel transport system ATP-binding protein
MRAVLEILNLTYKYSDGTRALDNLCLRVNSTESLAILGPNGSGKTTLLLHINGILRGEGSIRVAGLDVTPDNLDQIRKTVGVVFQDADEQLFMPTVLEDVVFGPLNLGVSLPEAKSSARQVLAKVGIGKELLNRSPFHLSAGEKRRVALAGVLVMEPQLLLLDEPTTSLDPPGQRDLVSLLRSLSQPMIIATHDVNFAKALCSRAVFLESGRVAADGDIDAIAKQFAWDAYA